ncbi:YegP family protein [uncultured Croceitalea sp.]|uniref:YegP family protein n=1 Tax=uncultured Croceitalea sp. TaxID=1798908 RepID=UPI003305CB79
MIEIVTNKNNTYQFQVKSDSGGTLLNSIAFKDKSIVETTLKSFSNTETQKYTVERKTNFDGKFLFHLKSKTGSLLGTSGLYSSEAGMENGIKNLAKSIAAIKAL